MPLRPLPPVRLLYRQPFLGFLFLMKGFGGSRGRLRILGFAIDMPPMTSPGGGATTPLVPLLVSPLGVELLRDASAIAAGVDRPLPPFIVLEAG